MAQYLFTSESVSAGHPDKVCDQISDLIVDLHLEQDPHARLAIETLATTNRVIIAGEYRSKATISDEEIETAIRELIAEIGYEQKGFKRKGNKSVPNCVKKANKGKFMDESEAHESKESKAQEARETRLEKKGYVETKSGKMKKVQKA